MIESRGRVTHAAQVRARQGIIRGALIREVPAMPPIRLLTPQEQTFKMALSALSPNPSAVHPRADLF